MVCHIGFEATVCFCFDEMAPVLALFKFEIFHKFHAVFELSASLFSNLFQKETLPACFSRKKSLRKTRSPDQFFSVELNKSSKLS